MTKNRWMPKEPKRTKKKTHEQIDAEIADFLARGGKIDVVPIIVRDQQGPLSLKKHN